MMDVVLKPTEFIPKTGATFFPSVFSLRSAPSLTVEGSSIMLDHFVEFVIGGTTPITLGPG